jgi:ectoine hydroxylase-related dioxygenase (phytanoyl-CoA dioxygenase family)
MQVLPPEQKRALKEDGYVVVKGVLSDMQVAALLDRLEHLWRTEGEKAGIENYFEPHTRRLASLAEKGSEFGPIFAHPLVLDACRAVIGNNVRLSMFNARDTLPRSPRQPFHCDINRAFHPEREGHYSLTAIWMLDEFTEENGATCILPRSHLTGEIPENALRNCFNPHPMEKYAVGARGDLLLLNGHCWHAGGENRSDQGRRGLLAHYLRGDYMPKPEENRQRPSAKALAGMTPLEQALFDLPNQIA